MLMIKIEINTKDAQFDLEKSENQFNVVFPASCGSDLEIKWESERHLNISYSISKGGVSTY
jgi:hypothetical protein